ncbi:biotin--[acetyl-CoA-carboxylase] ligase [Gilvibacter sediminis]|uniref:biotin--[acetyl-CoA-carboxylase] ligase n=1 Tax=Gilvibacter sediminis TaxID=379071 RepID=UPI0023500B04|nr:biotin--[acetyl-CoA-carboxylase] ligase [Gilvibacter sediminis]MDC7998527.1 biotin--[acetyl-CoA-carboxylase] ligase [Gilvibacter sediminis]
MKLIKLNATLSTNDYLKALVKTGVDCTGTVVIAHDQTQGRGQHGNHWYSKAGESLTFSLYRRFEQHPEVFPFMPQMVVALAIKKQLDALQIPAVSIKWPNDIMSYQKKIGGILIENIWSGGKPVHRVIGFGLNVNNDLPEELPRANSLKQITGKVYDLEELAMRIAGQIYTYFDDFRVVDQLQWYEQYLNALFKGGQAASFRIANGAPFTALVKGVTPEGDLELLLEDDSVHLYAVKAIEMIY